MFFDCYLFLVFPFNLFSHNSYNPKVRYLCLNQMYASVCVCVCVCVCYVYLHVCVFTSIHREGFILGFRLGSKHSSTFYIYILTNQSSSFYTSFHFFNTLFLRFSQQSYCSFVLYIKNYLFLL